MGFEPWIDDGQKVMSEEEFLDDSKRINGFQAGDTVSAEKINAALRQANLVAAGLMLETESDGINLQSTPEEVSAAISDRYGHWGNTGEANVFVNGKQTLQPGYGYAETFSAAWGGGMEGRTVVTVLDEGGQVMKFVKVSDELPNVDVLKNSTAGITMSGMEEELECRAGDFEDYLLCLGEGTPVAIVILNECDVDLGDFSAHFEETGTYFLYMEAEGEVFFVFSLNGWNVVPFAEEYIPWPSKNTLNIIDLPWMITYNELGLFEDEFSYTLDVPKEDHINTAFRLDFVIWTGTAEGHQEILALPLTNRYEDSYWTFNTYTSNRPDVDYYDVLIRGAMKYDSEEEKFHITFEVETDANKTLISYNDRGVLTSKYARVDPDFKFSIADKSGRAMLLIKYFPFLDENGNTYYSPAMLSVTEVSPESPVKITPMFYTTDTYTYDFDKTTGNLTIRIQ